MSAAVQDLLETEVVIPQDGNTSADESIDDCTYIRNGVRASDVLVELFLPIAAFLVPGATSALGRTWRSTARRFQEELARRDALSKTLYIWGATNLWDSLLHLTPGLAWKPRSWSALPPMTEARTEAVCALIGRSLYVCGGVRRGHGTNAAERLDLRTGKWSPLPPLLGRRRVDSESAAAAVLDGALYICGGLSFDGMKASNCVDRFDPEQLHWEELPSMPEPRCRAAAAVVDSHLYICGGSEGKGGPALDSVVRLDTKNRVWESLPPMIERRCGLSAIVANRNLYVGCHDALCGSGMEAPLVVTSQERFNVEMKRWSRCPPGLLSTPGASAAAAIRDCLYICGGSAHGQAHGAIAPARIAGTEQQEQQPRPVAAAGTPGGTRMLRRHWTT